STGFMFIASIPVRAAALLAALAVSLAHAHPAPQGGLQATVGPDSVRMRVTPSREEVSIGLIYLDKAGESERDGLRRYAEYLASHVHVRADGRALRARVVRIPGALRDVPLEFDLDFAYASAPPRELRVRQDALREFLAAPG